MIEGLKRIMAHLHQAHNVKVSRTRLWALIHAKKGDLYPPFPVQFTLAGRKYCADEVKIATWVESCAVIAQEAPKRHPLRRKKRRRGDA